MEDFVTFNIAKKLKEKGFREKCFAVYEPYIEKIKFNKINTDKRPAHYDLTIKEFRECYNLYIDNDIDAPTISQALKWLRKEHHLEFEIVVASYGYNICIVKTPDIPNEGGNQVYSSFNSYPGPNNAGAWDDYESCVLFGIEYAVNNLI